MASHTRLIRINEEIRKEISQLINHELKDPRIQSLISVLRVETTNDLKQTKVFVSMLGTEEEKKEALEGLKSAGGFIRKELAKRINLRNTPEVLFKLDESIEYSMHLEQLIKEVNKKGEEDS
ncbi:MAG: 30S ribosome-binding factor RbfA [Epulopiscium sp.]|nr:30S ribosome-binding factor RbfA [Candidatus Epulonipiscium sp.]